MDESTVRADKDAGNPAPDTEKASDDNETASADAANAAPTEDLDPDMRRDAFEAMVQSKLNFSPRTAQMLMAISRDRVLSNPKHASLLPPSWDTLYRLSTIDKKLGDGTLQRPCQSR